MWHDYWWMIMSVILGVPLISIAVFSWWLRRRPDIDVEKGVKCWDVFVKLVSALTIVASGAMIFGKYIDQQRLFEVDKSEQQRRELDFKKAEFVRQKLQFDTDRHKRKETLFDEVKIIAAKLANSDTPDKETIIRFEEMYHGSLIGVEKAGGPVESAMVQFRRKLKGLPGAPDEGLDQLSLQLSSA